MAEVNINIDEFKRTCEEKHNSDRGRIDKLENTVARIFEILDQYKTRPPWFVVILISGLATGCGSMFMYIITHGGK